MPIAYCLFNSIACCVLSIVHCLLALSIEVIDEEDAKLSAGGWDAAARFEAAAAKLAQLPLRIRKQMAPTPRRATTYPPQGRPPQGNRQANIIDL